jgi:hypothetical protein
VIVECVDLTVGRDQQLVPSHDTANAVRIGEFVNHIMRVHSENFRVIIIRQHPWELSIL